MPRYFREARQASVLVGANVAYSHGANKRSERLSVFSDRGLGGPSLIAAD
jgi:hypothetical protein